MDQLTDNFRERPRSEYISKEIAPTLTALLLVFGGDIADAIAKKPHHKRHPSKPEISYQCQLGIDPDRENRQCEVQGISELKDAKFLQAGKQSRHSNNDYKLSFEDARGIDPRQVIVEVLRKKRDVRFILGCPPNFKAIIQRSVDVPGKTGGGVWPGTKIDRLSRSKNTWEVTIPKVPPSRDLEKPFLSSVQCIGTKLNAHLGDDKFYPVRTLGIAIKGHPKRTKRGD